MQNANFYAMLYRFTALKRVIHRFTAIKRCSANTAAWRRFTAVKQYSDNAAARYHFAVVKRHSANAVTRRIDPAAAQRSGKAPACGLSVAWGAYTRRQAGAGSWGFTRVGELAAAKYLCA